MFIDNKYTTWYYRVISAAKLRKISIHYNTHHIIPESFFINRARRGPAGWLPGNPNEKDNKVRLTFREHFICHWLLTKMTTNLAKSKMISALWRMAQKDSTTGYKITSRMYSKIKEEFRNREISNSTRYKISIAGKAGKYVKMGVANGMFGKTAWNNGIPREQAVKDAISTGNTGRRRTLGPRSELAKERQSISMKAKLKILCPYCAKLVGGQANYNRWHGENCKMKGESKL